MQSPETTKAQLFAKLEEVQESEERYRKLSLLSSDFFHCCLRRRFEPYRISWLGGAVEKVTGYTKLEVEADGCLLKLLHPEDMFRVGARLLSLQPGEVGEQEFRFIHKDGSVRRVCESYICEAGGAPDELRLYGAIRDVTERRAKEERLRMAMQSLETTRECVYWIDEYGRILYVNPAAAQAIGYSAAELQQMSIPDIDPNSPAERWGPDGSLMRIMKAAGLRKFQVFHRHRDGHLIPMEVDSDGFYFEGKIYFIAMARDITERIKVQEVLVQTEKMMSLGGLAAGMAHEINNPLSGILQNVQVMLRRLTEDTPMNAQAAEQAGCSFDAVKRYMEKRGILASLEAVGEAGSRTARIVSSMLEFSRASAMDDALADLNSLLDKSLELCATDYDLKRKYDFSNIRVIKEYDRSLPAVPCSNTQIQQVFMNLLTNAAQAMAQTPSPTIVLRTASGNGFARIEIEDNGPGMTAEVLRRVFEPFFSTKPVGQGTGLGLSVSYFIICNTHHGFIEALSEPGQGTRFVIRLPLGSIPAHNPS